MLVRDKIARSVVLKERRTAETIGSSCQFRSQTESGALVDTEAAKEARDESMATLHSRFESFPHSGPGAPGSRARPWQRRGQRDQNDGEEVRVRSWRHHCES